MAKKVKVYKLNKEHLDIVDKFVGEEKKFATSLLSKYLRDYSIETISDLNTLKEVLHYEIIQNRLQAKMNEFADNKTIPIQLVEIMHKNSDAIIRLKNSLGLFSEKDKKDQYDAFKHLKRRFRLWLEENQGSRSISCPHCSKMVLLKIKTDIWESQKHPFFKDKVLANIHLVKLYKENKISKEDVASILECSVDYIDWLISKWYSNNSNNQQQTETTVTGVEEKGATN